MKKKYPVMLEYSSDNKHVVYMTEIDDKWYVVVVRDDEVLLIPTSEEMVPQEAVFISSENKLVPLHSDSKFLYWTVDNEFKLLNKDSQDMQVFGAEFVKGNIFGKHCDSDDIFKSPHVSHTPIKRFDCMSTYPQITHQCKKPLNKIIPTH